MVGLFYVDFAYEEDVPISKVPSQLRKLNEQFWGVKSLIFGIVLLDSSKETTQVLFDPDENIVDKYTHVLEEFFSGGDVDQMSLNVVSQLENGLFGVDNMVNRNGQSLNKMVVSERERNLVKKMPRPKLIKFKSSPAKMVQSDTNLNKLVQLELPKQTFQEGLEEPNVFMVYAKRLDLL